MVFEGLVVDLVNRFLGDYITNLDQSQLSLGIWGGDVVLTNLFLRENLLREFDLPFDIVFGSLERIKLKIPWKNLYSEPTVAQLDGLYLVAVPTMSLAYNEAKESEARWESKKKELAKIEAAKKRAEEKSLQQTNKQDTFAEKLVANVIKNLEVKISNIHIRYEDEISNADRSFSVGVTLKELTLLTTDENWRTTVIKNATDIIYKLVNLNNLSVYFDYNIERFLSRDRASILNKLKSTIGDGAHITDHQYMIEPMTAAAQLCMCMKPEVTNFTLPKILADVVFKQITIALNKMQYQISLEFLEALQRMQIGDRYRKYRPQVGKQGHAKQWWMFAYTSILEVAVRRRHKMWSWTHIRNHRQLCDQYKGYCKTKLMTDKPSNELLQQIESCERALDVFNIVLMRQQADIEVKKEGAKKKEKGSTSSGGGWFGWFGGSKKSEMREEKTIEDKVQEIMTPDEKQRLFDAIGYEENVEDVYPKEFVAIKLQLRLQNLLLKLRDESLNQPAVAELMLQCFQAKLHQRPAANAIQLHASMDSLRLLGIPSCDGADAPVLAASIGACDGSGESDKLINIMFETNPLDEKCDTRIDISSNSFEITYDARTIISLADFFRPPRSIYLMQLQAAAMAKLETARTQSALALQWAVYQQKETEIKVSLKPTCFIIPEQGFYRQNCRLLVIDLGQLTISTEDRINKSVKKGDKTPSQAVSMDDLKQEAYNRFKGELSSVQVLFAGLGDNWLQARTKKETPLHVLNPMSLHVDLFQCLVVDSQLPRMRLVGKLPSVALNMTDQRLTEILQLLLGIPLPESESKIEDVDELDQALTAQSLSLAPIREEAEDLLNLEIAEKLDKEDSTDSAYVNSTDIEMTFEIKEVCLNLAMKQGKTDVPTLKCIIESLGAQLSVRSFDTSLIAYLGGIYMHHINCKVSDEVSRWCSKDGSNYPVPSGGVALIETPASSEETFKLFTVDILLAHRKHPEFSTLYMNTLQRVKAEFSALKIFLHQDALLSITTLAQAFQTAVEKSKPTDAASDVKKHRRRDSSVSLASLSSAMSKLEPKKKRGPSKISEEIITMDVFAELKNLTIGVCQKDRVLTDIKITGMNARVTMKCRQTDVVASLSNVSVFDHHPQTIYQQILSVEGNELMNVNATVYNNDSMGKQREDVNHPDASFKLETGCMRVVFLNRFVMELLKFLNQFENAKSAIREAGASVADQAVGAAQDLSTRAFKLALDVSLKAPIVIVPESSKSTSVIVIDLGQLVVKNQFQKLTDQAKSSDGQHAVLDLMTVDLTQLNISSAIISGKNITAEHDLLQPVSLQVSLVRNLSTSWYHGHANLELSGRLKSLSVLLSQGDVKTLFRILGENLQEDGETLEGTETPSGGESESRSAAVKPPSSADSESTTDVYTAVKLDFTIETVQLELFSGDQAVSSNSKSAAESFARFQLKSIRALTELKSNNSMTAHLALLRCDLEDSRPNRAGGITKMISCSTMAAGNTDLDRMIDLTFQQDASSNKTGEAKMNGIHIVICVEYLLSLLDFVNEGLAVIPAKKETISASTSSTKDSPSKQNVSTSGELSFKVSLNRPEIVLVEDATNKETNAFILSMKADLSLQLSETRQMVQGSVRGLSISSCVYSSATHHGGAKTQVSPHNHLKNGGVVDSALDFKLINIGWKPSRLLQPLDVDLHSSAPQGKNHHIELFMTDIVLNVSQFYIRTLSTTLAALTVKQELEVKNGLEKIPKDLWLVKKLEACDFQFLKSSDGKEESGTELLDKELSAATRTLDRSEQFLLHELNAMILLTGNAGNRLIPVILTRMALKNVDIKDWSSRLSVSADLTLEVASYNDRLAVWEPVIEPVEVDNGRHRPWELSLRIQQNDVLAWDDDDVDAVNLLPPKMTLNCTSSHVLQLTISKNFLEVVGNLAKSYGDAFRKLDSTVPDDISAPFVITNETGFFVSIKPDDSFVTPETAQNGEIPLGHRQSVYLNLKNTDLLPKSREIMYEGVKQEKLMKVLMKVADINLSRPLTVSRVAKRSFYVSRQLFPGGDYQVVSQVDTHFGRKIVTLRSAVQVSSKLSFPVKLLCKLADNTFAGCGELKPDEILSMPCDVAYTAPYQLHVKPCVENYNESTAGCYWKDVAQALDGQILECKPSNSSAQSIFISAKLVVEEILFESSHEMTSKSFTLILSPTAVFRNLLPLEITYKLQVEDSNLIKAGHNAELLNACPGKTVVNISTLYQGRDWRGQVSISTRPETLGTCIFETIKDGQKKKMELGIHCEINEVGSQQLSLYSPYWMINKTECDLAYKATENYIVKHKAKDVDKIVFFVLKLVSLSSSNNKASLMVDGSDWSDAFSLDTVGSVGTVQCKVKDQTKTGTKKKGSSIISLSVGVTIALASDGITKLVTFTPYFMLINEAQFLVQCKEALPNAPWIDIPTGTCIPFWPTQTECNKTMIARIGGTLLDTKQFCFTNTSTTFLQLNHEYNGINVDCAVGEGAIKVVFQQYCPGFATVLIVNHTISSHIDYFQNYKDLSQTPLTLGPLEAVYYAWQDPVGKRELQWSCGESRNVTNTLDQDGIGDFFADGDTKLYWVSFLDGMQRVLLFTEDIAIATVAQQAGELEQVEQEININLQGLGISLVNNLVRKEIAFFGINSSGIIWEEKRRKRYTDLQTALSKSLEESYQQYLAAVDLARGQKIDGRRKLDNGKIEVDFSTEPMQLIKPQKVSIRRSFHYGIWMQYRTSPQQTQMHIAVHRLQLDSQLPGAIFPTVLAPVPPPKTVAAENAPKPFFEMSVMVRKSLYSDVKQIKYCKVLVQEFAIRIDQGFLTSIIALFESTIVAGDESRRLVAFQKECLLATRSLLEDAEYSTVGVVKNFYDHLHFSPLKVHLSFSLYGAEEDDKAVKKNPIIKWNVLSLFLQSIGVVLTDIQDVVFKLGYFERQHQFYSQNQLVSEISRHYSQQAIRQMYVLVLGLDVLGNPFGVIRGIAEGIEDFFYEPYQGIIQGPEEFAEGLAIGVKSLLGHAVGGAAGAVSRITGALGKGIATLTMDEEYQKKRREGLNRRPTGIGEGFARGGKGLVMGVFHGVTGIVTQPVEGAMQDGVGGFVKGIGKGLLGVFTRPASGFVDFASTSFDGIRRVTESSDEVQRMRPSRFIEADGILRPYTFRKAEGNQILKDIGKGAFLGEQYVGHLMLTADNRNTFIATDKQVIVACNDMLGHWELDWSYTYDQLKEPPTLSAKGIQILLKPEKEKWLFSQNSNGKLILVQERDRRVAEGFISKMAQIMKEASSK